MVATTAATSYSTRAPEFPAAVVIAEPALGYFVYWGGHLHGGWHPTYEDAAAHAAKLNAAPDWDLADWLTMQATERRTALTESEAAAVQVASASTPGVWYTVTAGTCTCSGYKYRGTCRHLVEGCAGSHRSR